MATDDSDLTLNNDDGLTKGQLSDAYDELRDVAYRYLSRERAGHTLQPTALVHEAYLRLMKQANFAELDGPRFVYAAARSMRLILVDHTRRRTALKRGGRGNRIALDELVDLYQERAFDLLALDEALDRLNEHDAQLGRIVELRFFGGLSLAETASALEVSTRTVERGWRFARMWLARELESGVELHA